MVYNLRIFNEYHVSCMQQEASFHIRTNLCDEQGSIVVIAHASNVEGLRFEPDSMP